MYKTKQPLISVIMPVYNAQEYLPNSIESILKQTYQNFELIIVDDASTDNSRQIIRKYKTRFPKKIRFISLQKNRNAGGDMCANEALKAATGTYVARMDADDISHPTRLAKQVQFLETHTNVFLVGSNALVIDKEGKLIGEKTEPQSSQAIYQAYFRFHPIIHPSVMFRRLLENNKSFTYEIVYSANNDYYTLFKLLCLGYKFVNLKEKLISYRIHGTNATFVNIKEKFTNAAKIRLAMMNKHGYSPTIKDIIILILQSMVVFLLPEIAITNLYLFAKGIRRPTFALPSLPTNILKSKTVFNSPTK